VDLDNFKSVNDTLGHQAGDALLRDVSQLLASAVRDYDSVVRYGGDEFVIVLSEASEDDARETIARLDRLVTEYASGLPGLAAIGFGASFGAATFPRDGSDMKALLEVADARMYNCKRSSRGSRQAA
jgi:diguanylate cyclase (GGDEF)-like protein